jgi:putative copper resistance protein D
MMALAAARGVYFAATMLLFGSAAFAALLRAKLPVIAPLRLNPLRWIALGVAVIAGCAWLALAAAQMADAMDRSIVTQAATDTLFGQLFFARMAALAGLGLTFLFTRGWRLAAGLAALALALPAVTSHTAAASPAHFTAIGATMDALHLLTAGFWIGGLAVLAALFARRETNMVLALSLFSDWAMVAVLLLVMSGLINGASVILGGEGHVSSLYLGVLGAKLVGVTAMLLLALVNRFWLMPDGAPHKIARNVALELGLGLVVILLAGVLGQLAPTL